MTGLSNVEQARLSFASDRIVAQASYFFVSTTAVATIIPPSLMMIE